jgi:outer membrane protein OmpA-like peptidoglycan-associated protein
MKKIIAIIFTATIIFANGLYDDLYLVNSNSNQLESSMDKHLMYGDFDQILRFKPIFFNSSTNEIKAESQDYLEQIVAAFKKHKDRDITITIIGYTDHVQTKTEKVNQSTWYPTYPNNLTIESSQEIAQGYATYTYDELINKGLPKEIIIVEQRGGLDNLYTRATQEGRELNYRAMVTMYIAKDKDADSDKDGVIDTKDQCKFTPLEHPVDKNGCSEILNLTIHYNVDSSVIRTISFEKLTKVIAFMNKYPQFKVLLYGHTSSEGTKLSNQILSEKRALSIRKYLIEQGINSSRISVYGRASTQPIASNETESGREENRRVEIKLY